MKTERTKNVAPANVPARTTAVCLVCHAPEAKSVHVAGTFNDWKPDTTPLQRRDDGTWSIELELAPGVYEYRFVVDDCWCDPAASETVLNPFGGLNAVLRIAPPA